MLSKGAINNLLRISSTNLIDRIVDFDLQIINLNLQSKQNNYTKDFDLYIRVLLNPSAINSFKWFIGHNGIIMGVMETMNSFGSFFFAFIGEKIINNDQEESNDEDNLYPMHIGKRVKSYLLMQIISLITAFILSLVLMYEKKDDNGEKDIMSDIEKTSDVLEEEKKNDGNMENENGEKTENKDESSKDKNEEEVKRSASSEKIEEKEKKGENIQPENSHPFFFLFL